MFLIAAIYDLVLGIVFTLFYKQAFDLIGLKDYPEGPYVMLIGAFLFVIGVAYLLIYLGDLEKNKDLIAVGTLYKLAYMSIAFFSLATGSIPHIAFALVFGICDIVFFVGMGECWHYIRKQKKSCCD